MPNKEIPVHNFKVCSVKELENLNNKNKSYNRVNSIFNEECVRLFNLDCLKFPSKYKGLKIIGCHCWTTTEDTTIQAPLTWIERRNILSSIVIHNKNFTLFLYPCLDNIFLDINFELDEDTYITIKDNQNDNSLFYCDLIAFFLVSIGRNHLETIDF